MTRTTNLSALVLRLLAVVSLWVSCSPIASSSNTDSPQPLQQRISVLALEDESLIDGVSRLSQTTNVAFAIEHILKPSVTSAKTVDPTFTAEIRGKTLREVLDWLCQMDSRYTWVSDSRTINIIPRSKLKDSQYLMNRTLHHFRLLNALRASQPVFRGLKELSGPHEQLAFLQVGGNLSYSEPWTQDFAEVSIRELLNLSARRLGPTFGWQLSGSEDFRIISFHAWLPSTKQAAPRAHRLGVSGISAALQEIGTVQPGMTREQLLRIFTTEGGLSSPRQRTYVYRQCPYIKVDVQFTAGEDARTEESPKDVITSVSRPYLALSSFD